MASASRWHALRIGCSVSLVFLVACSKGGGGDAAAPADEHVPAAVAATTVLATEGPFTETISAVGTVAPRASAVGAVSAPAATRITKVLVAMGQHVSAGEALVDLDRVTMDAEVERATAVLATAEAALQRAQRLAQQGISPQRDVESAQTDEAQAKASLTTAKRIAEQGVLHAPLAGVVTRITAVAGAMADPNTPLVEIADPNSIEILFTVSATDAGRLHNGAAITLRTSDKDSLTLGTATIQELSGTVDSATRGVVIRASSTKTERDLRIGETVVGEIVVAHVAKAVSVPTEALVPVDEGFQVFVVDSADIAHARKVTVGGRTPTMVRIVSGVKAGERVVTTGAYGMDDSAKVVRKGSDKP